IYQLPRSPFRLLSDIAYVAEINAITVIGCNGLCPPNKSELMGGAHSYTKSHITTTIYNRINIVMILNSLQSVAGIAVLALISGCSAVSVRGADNPKTPMANFTRPVQAGARPKQLTSVVGISGSHAAM